MSQTRVMQILAGFVGLPLLAYLGLIGWDMWAAQREYQEYSDQADLRVETVANDIKWLRTHGADIFDRPMTSDASPLLDPLFDKDPVSKGMIALFGGRGSLDAWRALVREVGTNWETELPKRLSAGGLPTVPKSETIFDHAKNFDHLKIANLSVLKNTADPTVLPYLPTLDFSFFVLLAKIHLSRNLQPSTNLSITIEQIRAFAQILVRSNHVKAIRAGIELARLANKVSTSPKLKNNSVISEKTSPLLDPKFLVTLDRLVRISPGYLDYRVSYATIYSAFTLDQPGVFPFFCAVLENEMPKLFFQKVLQVPTDQETVDLINSTISRRACPLSEYLTRTWQMSTVPDNYLPAPIDPAYWIYRPQPPEWIRSTIGRPIASLNWFLPMPFTRKALWVGFHRSNRLDAGGYDSP